MTEPGTMEKAAERARHGVSAVFLLSGAMTATWAVNIPEVRDRLHLTEGALGLALLAVGVGSLITMPPTGRWTARFGSGRVTAFGAVACVLSLLPVLAAPSYSALLLALLVFGGSHGLVDVAMNAQGVTVERRLGRPVMSRLHAFFSLGGVLGSLLGLALVGRVSLLAHGLLVAGLGTAAALLVGRWLLPDAPDPAQELGADSGPRFLLSPGVWLLGTLCFFGMLAEGANYDWAALYYRDILGVSGSQAGLGYAAFVAAMTLGRWVGDRARTRFGDEALVRGGALLTALGLGLALLAPQTGPATLGFALSGLGLSNVVPVLYGAAGHALAGRGIAQVATLGYGGFLLGPPLIGFLAAHLGLGLALGTALAGAGVVAALGGRAFRLLPPGRGAPVQ